MTAPLYLDRGIKDCYFCPVGIENTIKCFYHEEQKNVLRTYLKSFNFIEGVPSGNVWTIVLKLHKLIICPAELEFCDKVRF